MLAAVLAILVKHVVILKLGLWNISKSITSLIFLMLISTELRGCVMWIIYFRGLLLVRYECTKFHYYYMIGLSAPIHDQPQKGLSWIGLNTSWMFTKKCTAKPYFFLAIDDTLTSDNSLRFRNNLLERIQNTNHGNWL